MRSLMGRGIDGLDLDSVVVVKSPADIANVDSSKTYIPDGIIDMGTTSIEVPEGGITIGGIAGSRETARLISSADNYTMFTSPAGGYSGNVIFDNFSVFVTGTNSKVFDLDNAGNSGALDITIFNFENCTSIGDLTDYRQFFLSAGGFINCLDGLTFNGAWSGLVVTDSIAIASGDIDLIKAGPGATFSGSVRSNANFLLVGGGSTFMDFAPANILADEGLILNGFRTTATNAMPNMPRSNVRARYSNCRGLRNTYPGGQWTITATAATVIPAKDTPVKMAGTTTYSDLQWFSNTTNNAFVYDSTTPLEAVVNGVVSFSDGSNNEINVIIRQWDNSAGSYINLAQSGVVTVNSGGRAEGVSLLAYCELHKDDRIELWVENKTGSSNITAELGGILAVRER